MNDFKYNDGGKAKTGRKGVSGDCGVRAMAIALGIDYDSCYKELAQANKDFGYSKSARNGLHKNVYEYVLQKHGYVWKKAPKFEGRKAYYNDIALIANGNVILRMARHYSALVGFQINDIWDCRYKMVYGYWEKG